MKDRAPDACADAPEPPRRLGIGKKVVRQHGVQIEDGVRLNPMSSASSPSSIRRVVIEQGIGVALQTARVPRQVYQKPVQYLFCKDAGGLFDDFCFAELPSLLPLHVREIEAPIG